MYNLKTTKYNFVLLTAEAGGAKLTSFNLKNEKCHLKNDKNDHVLQT